MLVTPQPGMDRRQVREALSSARDAADNLRGPAQENAFSRLLRYLDWATETSGTLRQYISESDVDHLLLTNRYRALLSSCGTLAGSSQQRLVNGLVSLELAERVQALEEALQTLQDRISRWTGREWFVVADSSFYIQNSVRLADADLHLTLGLPPAEPLRLLFPIVVVDELDNLKDAGKQRARYRAAHTLGLLDSVLSGSTCGILHAADLQGEPAAWRGEVNLEIVLDQPGHVRLPITDDEIIDRAVAVQRLAAREVRLLTCDTGQHTRGRAAGLKVTKVPAKDPGPEPDWETADRPGSGIRARRRERQSEQDHRARSGGG
ncbi:PIN domain-containing protein [Streptomyces sp. NPDC001705]